MSTVCLIHLVWAPLGAGPVERFAGSYRARRPGLDHRLVVVFNGFENGVPEAFSAPFADIPHDVLETPGPVQDLAAYRLAAERAESAQTLCFLNSHAEPLVDGWLELLYAQLRVPGVGVVGATGSHESRCSGAARPVKPLRALSYPRFPNPHLRTNGFMIERELMLALDWRVGRAKRDAYRLESGRRSITRQVLAQGRQALVAGRDGRGYAPAEWADSGTFRCRGQENLLIADNRTRQYADALPPERDRLERMAWGASHERSS